MQVSYPFRLVCVTFSLLTRIINETLEDYLAISGHDTLDHRVAALAAYASSTPRGKNHWKICILTTTVVIVLAMLPIDQKYDFSSGGAVTSYMHIMVEPRVPSYVKFCGFSYNSGLNRDSSFGTVRSILLLLRKGGYTKYIYNNHTNTKSDEACRYWAYNIMDYLETNNVLAEGSCISALLPFLCRMYEAIGDPGTLCNVIRGQFPEPTSSLATSRVLVSPKIFAPWGEDEEGQ